jgi:hypothetical protein
LNRIRWLILILGPLPIVGSSWAVSSWFRSEPRAVVMRNSVLPSQTPERVSTARPAPPHIPANEALTRDCHEAAARLRSKLGSGCEVIVEPPFVLAGDLERPELAALYEQTIAPAVRAMRSSYFDARPNRPITVLVFRGEESYNRRCEELFGERGISIYGYYKPNLRTLVLNIATGNGTLLHELTHALVDFDFPQIPDWLNEGLASLHEQSQFRAGPGGAWIEGLPNWRLAGLQQVVRSQKLGSIKELVENPQFRGRGEGTNYAQARYFCLYMQKQGVLAKFYRSFRASHGLDPRGLKALARAFPGVGIEELDRDFQGWVLTLNAN